MQCPQCGNELSQGSNFCGKCGTRVEEPVSAVPASASETSVLHPVREEVPASPQPVFGQGAPVAQPAAQPVSAPVYAPAQPQVPANPYARPEQGAGYTAHSQTPHQGQPSVPAQRGCLGAAFHDITTSPGWVKRVLLLMVMKCVPVLSFYASGYNVQWGAQAARGDNSPLPRGTFDKKTFLTGLFMVLLTTLLNIANVWMLALNFIPFVGFVLVFVINLFAGAFYSLAVMRMALYKALGQAFELSEIFRAYKKRIGSLIAAACVPAIIVNVVFVLLLVLILLIMAAVSFAGSSAMYGYSSYGSSMGALGAMSALSYDPVGAVFGIISALGAMFFVIGALYLFLSGLAEIWSMRAVGLWVARFVPEWAEEAKDSEGSLS